MNLNLWPKTFHYPPDGSGRDRYIKFSIIITNLYIFFRINEGGLQSYACAGRSLKVRAANFMKELRTYTKSNFYNKRKTPDYFQDS